MSAIDRTVARLREALGDARVSVGSADRVAYAGDMWPRLQVAKLQGRLAEHRPDAVVWPESSEQVASVLQICHQERVPVIPFGAGSGVCGGAVPDRGGITVDLRRMDRIVRADPEDFVVDVEAGVIGHHCERALNEAGLTLGHFPSSILCSTVGGWVAARSAGQCSSKYGKIEDMVLGLEVVLAGGEILRTGRLGRGAAVDFTPLFVGCEGTLGIITRVVLRAHPFPEARAMRGFRFRDVESALEAMRRVMVCGLEPAVLRLYDPVDTLLSGATKTISEEHAERAAAEGPPKASWARRLTRSFATPLQARNWKTHFRAYLEQAQGRALQSTLARASWLNRVGPLFASGCKLITGVEGERDRVAVDAARLVELVEECGGEDLGEGPGLHWLEHRYDVSFKQMKVFGAGAFVDTMEVATTWTQLVEVYDRVRQALTPHVVVMAHFSHAYPEGCSIYFTFAGAGADAAASAELYDLVWKLGLDAVVSAGAAVSHHHGVGLSKRDALARSSADAVHLFYAAKQQFDPHYIMNPGKVFAEPSQSDSTGPRGGRA